MGTATITDSVPSLTVDAYRQLANSGAISDGTPLELIGGVLILKDRRDDGGELTTVGRRHASAIRRIERMLLAAARDLPFVIQSQLPIVVDEESAPEPDVAALRGNVEDYDLREPTVEDAVLLIEVADSSLPYDRGEKLRRYLNAGVRHYWVVNLRNDTLEQFGQTSADSVVFDPMEIAEIEVPELERRVSLPAMFPPG